MCLRKFLLGLGLLLLLSVPLFSDVVLTEAEYQELMESLTISETALIEQEKTIETLQTELTALKNLSKIQSEIIETLSTLSKELKISLAEQKVEINGGLTAVFDDGIIKPGIYLGISY